MTPKRILDRPAIFRSALALVDREGLGALNMRALAQDLGVGTMSLYHHVPSKDALLDGIVQELQSEIHIPARDFGSWEQRAMEMARSFRKVALAHPNCIPLLVTRPFSNDSALVPCEVAFGLLAEGGFSPDRALVAFRAIVAYVLGFVMMESGGFFGGVHHDRDPEELRAAGMCNLADIVPHLNDRDFDADFDTGLRMVVGGAVVALASVR